MKPSAQDPTLDDIVGDVEQLPEDWQINLEFQQGLLDVVLIDPKGELVEVTDPDEENAPVHSMIRRRIDHARRADGLGPAFRDVLDE
jgi:hypothetical protein